MNNTTKLVVSILVLIFLMIGAYFLYEKLSEEYEPQNDVIVNNEKAEDAQRESVTQKAPDFEVTDGDGNAVRLSDFIGKPIVLNFWASWCPPCKAEMPDFDNAYIELGDDIQFLMVNLTDGGRETVELAKAHVEDSGYSFPVYFDTKSDAANTYGVMSIPTTVFIDSNGNLIAHAQGMIDADTLQRGIDMISE